GMGDLAHILNVGENLKKTYADTCDVVYEIQWNMGGYGRQYQDKPRVKMLIEKLQYLGIIQEPNYDDNKSPEEMIAEINQLNAPPNGNRIHLFTTRRMEDFKPGGREEEKFKDSDVWIVTSAPAFEREKDRYHALNRYFNIGMGSPGKTIFCSEHTGVEYLYDSINGFRTKAREGIDDEESRFYSVEDKLVMGFGNSNDKVMAGFLLDKTEATVDTKIDALMRIESESFNELLHGSRQLEDKKKALDIEKNTIFVPNYHSHGRKHALDMFIHFYQNTLPQDSRDIIMQGNFELEAFQTKKQALMDAGFTRIEYYNKATDTIEAIQWIESPEQEKTFKVFTGRLDDQDYAKFTHCANLVSGCSGDNTLQDAINTGAIPLFMPNTGKARVLADLKELLEEHTPKFDACIQFLEMYAHYESYQQLAAETSVYSPELMSQWKEVCTLLKEEYNTHDFVSRAVSQKLGVTPDKKTNLSKEAFTQLKTKNAVLGQPTVDTVSVEHSDVLNAKLSELATLAKDYDDKTKAATNMSRHRKDKNTLLQNGILKIIGDIEKGNMNNIPNIITELKTKLIDTYQVKPSFFKQSKSYDVIKQIEKIIPQVQSIQYREKEAAMRDKPSVDVETKAPSRGARD
ncbi:MAG: hypothetical protein QNK11_01095, partial [Legionella sp.]|nr:hypothetical protein [Legionella sp.]